MNPQLAELIERHEKLLELDTGGEGVVALTDHEKSEHLNMGYYENKTACGTTHCLAGFAAIQPYFTERGFAIADHFVWYEGFTDQSACDAFFGDGAFAEMFHYAFRNNWEEAMARVKIRLARLKASA